MTELYKRFPKLCTCWAFFEVVFFAGIVFGWGSLVFILKEEGFYSDACIGSNDDVKNNYLTSGDVHVSLPNDTHHDVIYPTNATNDITNVKRMSCDAQESRLNLWFSIAVSVMYLSFTVIGYIIRSFGTRTTRLIFM